MRPSHLISRAPQFFNESLSMDRNLGLSLAILSFLFVEIDSSRRLRCGVMLGEVQDNIPTKSLLLQKALRATFLSLNFSQIPTVAREPSQSLDTIPQTEVQARVRIKSV